MRIISPWRDYYDGCRAWGEDRTVIYVRERKEHPYPWPEWHHAKKAFTPEESAVCDLRAAMSEVPTQHPFLGVGIVAFAGDVHPIWWVLFDGRRDSRPLWTIEQVEAALVGRYDRWGRALSDQLVDYAYDAHRLHLSRDSYREYVERGHKVGDEVHRALRSPVLWADAGGVTANPLLAGTGFESVVPPVQAWQRLAQYVGSNMAGGREPGFTGGDVVKRDAHGFDAWSFRRHPDESKKPRRR